MQNLVALFTPDNAPQVEMRARVLRLEEELRKYPQLPEEVKHHFSPGIYARELFIPKGAILTGKIHRGAHLNVMPMGDISVLTEHGVKRLKGPCVIQSSAGIKRAGYAHESTIWITIHPNPDDERDLEKLESRYIAPSFAALEDLNVIPDLIEVASGAKAG